MNGVEAAGWRFRLEDGLARLPEGDRRSTTLFGHGSMTLKIYAPRGHDPQTPHAQDEIYVVVRGRGRFVVADTAAAFGPGDALFAPAGVPHRFEDFTDDLAVWVVFYGPAGGEADR